MTTTLGTCSSPPAILQVAGVTAEEVAHRDRRVKDFGKKCFDFIKMFASETAGSKAKV